MNIISVKSFLLYKHVVHHSVHHTMGDVTFTDCTVGGFAGPGGNIGTASVSSQLQPTSGTEGVFKIVTNFPLQVGDDHRIVKINSNTYIH